MKLISSVLATSLTATLLALNSGCMVGPTYQAPQANAPAAFRWSSPHTGESSIATNWWSLYQDPALDRLMSQALEGNNNLKEALSRVDEARALAHLSRSALLPSLDAGGSASKVHFSQTSVDPFPHDDGTDLRAGLDFGYEVDLWGRLRRSAAASRADAEATADEFQMLRLGISTDVAIDYFSLRALDTEMAVLIRAVSVREESVSITGSRARSQINSDIDFSRAKAELAIARGQLVETRRQRNKVEDALAVLCGAQPGSVDLQLKSEAGILPTFPVVLPTELLRQRPDVAAAERRLLAASERIGIAQVGYFPTIRLEAAGGYNSSDSANLFKWASRFVQAGPSVSVPIFNGGRIRADVDASKARFDAAKASWQQSVLVAFKEVDDALSDQQLLGELAQRDSETQISAQDVVSLSGARYRSGLVNYLDVVDAERTELQAERDSVRVIGQQFIASVELVKALGGGWHTDKAEPASNAVASERTSSSLPGSTLSSM